MTTSPVVLPSEPLRHWLLLRPLRRPVVVVVVVDVVVIVMTEGEAPASCGVALTRLVRSSF